MKNYFSKLFNNMKLSLPITFAIIGLIFFLIIILSSNFERSTSPQPYGTKFSKLLILLICLYFIIKIVLKKKISSKKTNFMGFFKIEKGLLIYLFIVLLVSLLL